MTGSTVAIIVVAAGSGTRLGAAEPKALVTVGGQTILEHALSRVFDMTDAAQVVVVAPANRLDDARALATRVAGAATDHVTVVAGGDTRQQSVSAGLAVLEPGVEVVLVHDSARAFTPAAQFEAVIAAVRATGGGVIPGLAVADTIKQLDWTGAVERTVDRSQLVAVQTPQGFPRDGLLGAYASAAEDYTDDAAVFAAAGLPVTVVDGDPLAFKITTPWDLRRAESILGESAATGGTLRTGVGIDVHGFDPDQPLWLGGLHWPGEPGLAGHSDGDAVAHAVCDALLSAAGLGDIGGNFGTDDPRFAGAHGDVFVCATVRLVIEAGFAVENVAVQIVGNRPKVAPRRILIEQRMSDLVGAPVSVSATTTDGLGFTGRGEGVTAIATALLRR
ncbi:bifunctional 2-C-methyl-D-erythritol 4-phosphate cytidylyltransferase/2-C-methyl-D-erythritol 2,4-cyclodiphosphate synthase [Conyzicola nivalis]|uniref:Bifunctional enzyme IspD/IspF n=1 Tax=Conyzicola nivalis TaxID=1477021 RepID=A0A916WMR5_9MICO|nr:2-C-methyl-D-erythritol 4-phosphate cytidylyltransferase [Conyzicola nivalis]GGB13053.1 bifunctional enzyme IspD/IspF [Conyzicola nivalis]